MTTTSVCPGCAGVAVVRSSHPITVQWKEREPGVYRGEAVGATTETTKRFSMIFDNGDSARWESWPKAEDIDGRPLGEIHHCSVEPPTSGDRVSSPV